MFPEDEIEGNIKTRGKPKLTSSPEGPHMKCFVIYLDCHVAKTNKQRRCAGNNCAIVSRYI